MRSQVYVLSTAVLAVCSFASMPARADLMMSIQSVTVNAGSTGNLFDVLLTNNGPAPTAVIESFTFGIETIIPGITFTGVTTATSTPYIFGGDSLFGPAIGSGGSGSPLIAGDLFDIPSSGVALDSGKTVGLGSVSFDVDPGVDSGTFSIDLSSLFTSIADSSSQPVDVNLRGGSITVNRAVAMPEPSAVLELFMYAVVVATALIVRRWVAKRPA